MQDQTKPCKNCGCCPECGQPIPQRYVPYYPPYIPYIPSVFYPGPCDPIGPYIGDNPYPTIICGTYTSSYN